MVELIDADTHRTLVADLEVVPAFSIRGARGLLGRRGLHADAGLLLSDPLGCIHTFGMRFPIDIVFLDRDLLIVGLEERVAPWRLRRCRRSRHQLEVAAGTAARRGLAIGRRVLPHAARGDEGGQARRESPHVLAGSGEPAHVRRSGDCETPVRLPSVPPSGGQSRQEPNLPERTTP